MRAQRLCGETYNLAKPFLDKSDAASLLIMGIPRPLMVRIQLKKPKQNESYHCQ